MYFHLGSHVDLELSPSDPELILDAFCTLLVFHFKQLYNTIMFSQSILSSQIHDKDHPTVTA